MAVEPWLQGAIEGVPALFMPAAHALLQAKGDLATFAANLSLQELWARPNNVASIGFHLLHISGSIDRLHTYTANQTLSAAQFEFLQSEQTEQSGQARDLVAAAQQQIDGLLEFICQLPDSDYFAPRYVGRARLATNVFGLIFHTAEHTQRHVGAIIAQAQIVRGKTSDLA